LTLPFPSGGAGGNNLANKGVALSKLLFMFLLLMLGAVPALAEEEKASSVLIIPYGDKDAAGVVADYLEGEIGKRLNDQCIDYASMADIKAAHKAEQEGELLGKETNEELLENLINLYNSRYVLTIVTLTHPNGQMTSSVRVVDRATGKTVAEGSTSPAEGEAAFENVPALAENILGQLSSRFPNQCQDRWVGTITTNTKREHRSEQDHSEPAGSWPGQPPGPVNTSTHAIHDTTTDRVEVTLQPLALGNEGADRPMARVVRTFEMRMRRNTTSLTWIKCGPFGVGQPNPMRQANREQSHLIVERGQASSKEKVTVLLDRESGRYTIEVRYPSVVKKRREERRDSNPGNRCQPVPQSSSADGEEKPLPSTLFIKVSGQVDPANPNVLAGTEVTGSLEGGQTMKQWNLRLVRPQETQSTK